MIEVSFGQFLLDLANPQLGFLARAVIIAMVSAIVCGVVGCFVVLRGMAFIGDAVSHAVFPGLAIAFSMQASLVLGGAVAGGIVAICIAVFAQRRRVGEDSIIGIFFAAAFALGMLIISRTDGYTASLSSFLFGALTGVERFDVILAAVVGAAVIGTLALLRPQLVAACLDRESARAMGLPVLFLDIVLYLAVTAAVVISVGTIGNILVLALLITPAATARQLTSRLTTMFWLAAGIGAGASFFGIYLAWAMDLPAGATIVLLLTACFLVVWALSPLLHNRPAVVAAPGSSSVPADSSEPIALNS